MKIKHYTSIAEFEKDFGVKLIKKNSSWLMRATNALVSWSCPDFMKMFTTYRLPFQSGVIAYPDDLDPLKYPGTLEHELMHVEQERTGWGLFKSALLVSIFPLPVFFSGRWHIERKPYLADIKKGFFTPEEAVDILWDMYGWCWPRSLMLKWFKERL